MALQENQPLGRVFLTVTMADLSTSDSVFIPCPVRGELIRLRSSIKNAISVANSTVTMEINGTAVTGLSMTVAYSGSAAGDCDSATPTAKTYVKPGDAIEIISDGGSTTTCITTFLVEIEKF